MEYYKTYCSSHPYQTVTNFCADAQCLTGLCATCICEHTLQHQKRGSPPRYENIKNTFAKYSDKMKDQINKIEQDKQWLGSVCQRIQDKRRSVKVTLSKARDDCLALVQKHFDELESKIESEINNQCKKNSLHSSYRLQTLNTLLLKEVSNLVLYSKDLGSSKFLETVQQIEQEVLPNSNDFHARVSKELKQNQLYTANVAYKEQILNDVALVLKRLIHLQFVLPRLESFEQIRREDFRRASSVKKNASIVISPAAKDVIDFSRRNVSTINSFTPAISVMMPNSIFQQTFNPSILKSQSEANFLNKQSRISGLKIIHESNRENSQNDFSKSITSSSVSYDKQNEVLAQSTYYDTNSSFFK